MRHFHRLIRCVIILSAVACLVGCKTYAETERARLCRIAVQALSASAETVSIERQTTLSRTRHEIVAWRPARDVPRRDIIVCTFQEVVDATGPRLIAIDRNGLPIAVGRVWALTAYGLRQTADPAPERHMEGLPMLPARLGQLTQVMLVTLPQTIIYGLLAAGLALTHGLTGRINLAYGDIVSLASYTALIGLAMALTTNASAPLFRLIMFGVLGGLVWSSAVGMLTITRLGTTAPVQGLIASLGLAVVIQELLRLTQGPGNRVVGPRFADPIAIAGSGNQLVTVTPLSLGIFVLGLIAALGILALLRFTRVGRIWRALSDDLLGAQLCGIDPRLATIAAFVVAGAMAGLAGVFITLHFGTLTPSGGLILGLKALLAAVIGGVGSVPGAFAGGLIVGVIEAAWSVMFPIESRDAALFALLVVALVVKPEGIFTKAR
jgi:branched-subunit amino acid ABC-type transport system permease component